MSMNDVETVAWIRQAANESCWMCGIRLRAGEMIADGGSACPDVRWYCRDLPACTQRWTGRLRESDTVAQLR
jgi:hypothetical protein